MLSISSVKEKKRQPLEVEVYEFLHENGINLLPYWYVTSSDELENILHQLKTDKRYVMKVMSPKILHKSDFNAVVLDVPKNKLLEEFEGLYDQFDDLEFEGVLIVPMAGKGIEFLIGSTTDPTFGVITVFGIGGTMVELIDDVTFAKSPVDIVDANQMLKNIKTQAIFDGPRGLPKTNKEKLAELIVKVSSISSEYKDLIREIDLNPVRVTKDGIYPLDARVIFHPETC